MKTYKERYTNERRKNIIESVLKIEQMINDLFPQVGKRKTILMLSRCAHYHYYKGRELGTEERMLYDLLIKYNFNPFRVYKWFRLSVLPEDVKHDIERGKLSQKNAIRIHTNRHRQLEVSHAWKFMEEARRLVREVIA